MTPETFAVDFMTRLADVLRLAVGILGLAGLVSAALLLTAFRGDMNR